MSDFLNDPKGFRPGPAREERTHVTIDPTKQSARDAQLFTTAGLALDGLSLPSETQLAVRVGNAAGFAQALDRLDGLHPFGGERRLVRWQQSTDPEFAAAWTCPDPVRSALQGTGRVRMVLASPAVFKPAFPR